MPIALQTRLLQVLSDGEVTPIGATRPIPVDLALISATHHDLERRVQVGAFREDLYFRLNGATLALPPLRERRDRIDIIEAVFVEEAHRGGARIRLAAAARTCLAAHLWPGNIRELRHAMRYVVALVDHGEVRPEHLPPFIAQQPAANGKVPPPTRSSDSGLPAPSSGQPGTLRPPRACSTSRARPCTARSSSTPSPARSAEET